MKSFLKILKHRHTNKTDLDSWSFLLVAIGFEALNEIQESLRSLKIDIVFQIHNEVKSSLAGKGLSKWHPD